MKQLYFVFLAFCFSASVFADEPPRGRGELIPLRSRSFESELPLAEVRHRSSAALRNLPGLLSHFEPALPPGGSIRGLRMTNSVLSFDAALPVNCSFSGLSLPRVNLAQRLVAVASARRYSRDGCGGFELRLDLRASDEHISNQADAILARLCFSETPSGTRLSLSALMEVGPDYGTRCAGKFARDLLSAQIPPLENAIREAIR